MSSDEDKKPSAEEAAQPDDYDGPESLRGVELVPADSVFRLFDWKNCKSVREAYMQNSSEHPEVLVRMFDIGVFVMAVLMYTVLIIPATMYRLFGYVENRSF